jgi:hypothetical protein
MQEKWRQLSPSSATQVVVAWRDIHEISSWNDDGDALGPVHLETIGWLLYEGPDPAEPESNLVIIAKTYDYTDKRWADYTVFPRTVVKRIKREIP